MWTRRPARYSIYLVAVSLGNGPSGKFCIEDNHLCAYDRGVFSFFWKLHSFSNWCWRTSGHHLICFCNRSEERRVGKECRSRWASYRIERRREDGDEGSVVVWKAR